MSDNKQPDVKCPLCGGEITFESTQDCFTNNVFFCNNEKCKAIICYEKLSSIEVIARYQQRPESAWEMFHRLLQEYGDKFKRKCAEYFYVTSDEVGIVFLWNINNESQALSIMQQIEKELEKQ